MTLEISNKVDVYEIDGEEVDDRTIEVNSHWQISNSFIILKIKGQAYTIDSSDLIKAINNASNI